MAEMKKLVCKGCKKAAPKSPRSRWCRPCYKARRTKQLKQNNVVWRDRVAKGKAGHHVKYRSRPTAWAAEHKAAAIALAKKYKVGGEEAVKVVEKFVHAKKPVAKEKSAN